jgi:hypothetical protein
MQGAAKHKIWQQPINDTNNPLILIKIIHLTGYCVY